MFLEEIPSKNKNTSKKCILPPLHSLIFILICNGGKLKILMEDVGALFLRSVDGRNPFREYFEQMLKKM